MTEAQRPISDRDIIKYLQQTLESFNRCLKDAKENNLDVKLDETREKQLVILSITKKLL